MSRVAIKKLRYAAEFLRPIFVSPAFAPTRVKHHIEASTRLQGALGALNDRRMAKYMLADLEMAAGPNEGATPMLKALAKQAAAGAKRRRRKLEDASKAFTGIECFWARPVR